MNITSRQLKAFLLTARHESFSRAAEQLFITQSGMSVLVRELESQLGFRLFERTTRKVKLTEFGSKFLPIADRSLLELESAALNISRSATAADGCMSIGAAPLVAAELLPPAIADYGRANPNFQIRLIDAEGNRLTEMVQSGVLDAALTVYGALVPGIRRVPLLRFSLIAISSEKTREALPREVRWSDVAKLRLVGFPDDYPIQHIINEHLQRAGRHDPSEVVCNYLETQIAMVEVGAGIAVVPTYAVPACIKRKVTMHAISAPVVSGNLYWVVNRARELPDGAELFCAYLKDYLSCQAARWLPETKKAA